MSNIAEFEADKPKTNDSGERLYHDSDGVECNLEAMLRREPEWVAHRFRIMEDRIAELEESILVSRNRDLRKELNRCEATSEARHTLLEAMEEDIEEMDAEIKRLRGALEDVTGAGTVGCEEMQRIAEKALLLETPGDELDYALSLAKRKEKQHETE